MNLNWEMNQCVPGLDLEEPPYPPSFLEPISEYYEVAPELTRRNRQNPVTIGKPIPKYPSVSFSASAWEKPLIPVADALVPNPTSELGGIRKRTKVASQGSTAPPATVDTFELNSSEDVSFGATTESASSTPPSDLYHHGYSFCGSMKYQGEAKGRKGGKWRSTRKRAAAIHSQSERRRRNRINEKIKILQKLVPNSTKTNKASMLDEAIEYLKQLKAQVQMMNIFPPHMMLPLPMLLLLQQQLQMTMLANIHMAQMTQMSQIEQNMGFGVGTVGMGPLSGHGSTGIPPVFLPSFAAFSAFLAHWVQRFHPDN